MDIRECIADLIVEAGHPSPDTNSTGFSTATLFSNRFLDSLAFVRLLLAVESLVGGTIEERDLITSNFDSVGAIEALIGRYRETDNHRDARR